MKGNTPTPAPLADLYPILLSRLKTLNSISEDDFSLAIKHLNEVESGIESLNSETTRREIASERLLEILGVDKNSKEFISIYQEIYGTSPWQ